ncbi:MAG TPA: hypothetical protein DHV48_13670 [Prolixibacteraceae bacterium]|nr:hypothetical protein [Prolixibacteraceae bacterium]
MKAKLFFLFFFIGCSAVTFTSADNLSNIGLANFSSTDKKEEVLLAGTLETGMIKSLSIIPFEVWKSSTSIDISYLSTLSNITVEIKDESGQTFYHSIVNPVSGGQLIIDIQGWGAGTYTITLSNDKGGYVYGTFVI